MATAYTTIGSKFQPYTLAEMLVPYQMYKQEYDKREELYNTYAENAGLIGSELDSTLDGELLNSVYNPYMDSLNAAASDLSKNGLSAQNRRSLQELRRRFGKEIAPIKIATEARNKAKELWDKLSSQDRTLMTNANPYYKGVSEYMNGKSPETYYVSGNELYGRGKALANAFSKTLRSVPNYEGLAANLDDQYFKIITQYGPDSQQMKNFMNDIVDSIPELKNQVSDILNSTDIFKKGFTDTDRIKAEQYIIEGMKAGLSGETKVDYLQNRDWEFTRRNPSKDIEQPKDPLDVITFSGGIDSTSNAENDRLVTLASSIVSGEDGAFSTPELDRLKENNKYSTEQINEAQELVRTYERLYGTPTIEPTNDPEKINIVRRMPDGSINNSKISKDQQKKYEKAKEIVNNGTEYIKKKAELDSLIETAKFFAGKGASQQEIIDAANTYAAYLRGKQATESVRINASLKDSALNNKVMSDWTNAVSGELKQGKYNSISIVEDGISRPLKEKEVKEFQNILSNSTNFTVHFDSTIKDKKGIRTPIVFTYKGTGKDDAVSFTINSDMHMKMIKEYNAVSKFLTDFEPSSLEDVPTLYSPSSEEIFNLSKGSELPGGIGLVYYDGSSGEYVKSVAIIDREGKVRIFSETMDDLAHPVRGGSGLGNYIKFIGEEFLRTTYGK